MPFPYAFPFPFIPVAGPGGPGGPLGAGSIFEVPRVTTAYQAYQPSLGPTWLKGTYGALWLRAFGQVKDGLVDRLKAGIKARMPLLAPHDALEALGVERGIDRATGESDTSYAARVQQAWDAWEFAGTAKGILVALAALGYTAAIGQANRRMFTLDGDGEVVVTTLPVGSWASDATQAFWSTFQVIFPQPLPTDWLAGGLTSVFHGGTGAGTATFTGTPTADYRIATKIMSTAAAGTATYQWSSDHGQTWSSTATTPTSATALGTTGVSVAFSGALVSGDVYAVAPTFNVPASGSAEAEKIRLVVRKWQPATATNRGYVIVTRGETFGCPALHAIGAGAANLGFIGGSTTTTWTA